MSRYYSYQLNNASQAVKAMKTAIAATNEACTFLLSAQVDCLPQYPELSEACERRQKRLEDLLTEQRKQLALYEQEYADAKLRDNLARTGTSQGSLGAYLKLVR